MEKLTYNIGEKIGNELGLSKDKKEVIAYGAFAILQTFLSLSLTALLGLFFGVLIDTLIISFTIYILRKYSGGVHASTPFSCAIISSIIVVILSLFVSNIVVPVANLNIIIPFGLISFAWSYYTVYKLAPVDSLAKPIKTEKKKNRMRKTSIKVLHIYLVIVISNILFYLYAQKIFYLNFSLCIYGGILWQSFTLTKGGHVVVFKIDSFLNKLFNSIRR